MFREHKWLLDESMKTVREVASREELIRHLQSGLQAFTDPMTFDWSTLQIDPYFMQPDHRIGWSKTWIVHMRGYGVFGFTDAEL